MRKENSTIFVYLILLFAISACGVKGPLYQTPVTTTKQADASKEINKLPPVDNQRDK